MREHEKGPSNEGPFCRFWLFLRNLYSVDLCYILLENFQKGPRLELGRTPRLNPDVKGVVLFKKDRSKSAGKISTVTKNNLKVVPVFDISDCLKQSHYLHLSFSGSPG
jgi:hypothetical protein